MDTIKTKSCSYLFSKERDLIAICKGGGIRLREIAKKLEKSPGAISDEIKRNLFF